jgi:pyruvate formate lyase activating enzyme
VYNRRQFIRRASLAAAGFSLFPIAEAVGRLGEKKKKREDPFVREARYYEKLEKGLIRCHLCPHECVVPPGGRGNCEVRENRKGQYYTLVYGNPCALHVDPIEKKPFFHLFPGSTSFSLSTAGCNLDCRYCQNWQISQVRPEQTRNYDLPPEEVVAVAKREKCRSIAYTYTEPTIFFEYMLDTSAIARKHGILNVYHSNGFINPKPLDELCKTLDAANVDLKWFSEDLYSTMSQGRLAPVLETLKTLRKRGVWLEITNLVVPGYNDDPKVIRKMTTWIASELGPDVPLHFSRFSPTYRLKNLPPTPVPTLEKARVIAQSSGLMYVYIGNVVGHEAENTYCPGCKKVVIRRVSYSILSVDLKAGRCAHCKTPIAGIWD